MAKAKGRLPARRRHAHNWSYDEALYFSDDRESVFVSRFCIGCGVREIGEAAWRTPTGDELALILQEQAKRDANPRAELEKEYERGFLECCNRIREALQRIATSG